MLKNERFDSDSPEYSKSELKEKMDKDILPIFESDFGKENIIEHEVDLITVDMQKDYGKCACKVRPLTFDEAREYNDLIVNKELDDFWWTCTPWSTEERGWTCSLAVVSPAGDIAKWSYDDGSGVRPACILKSNIFASKG